jgi:peptide deformylase
MKAFNPYEKYASSTNITSLSLVEDWNCEMVEPNHPALHTPANLNPFGGDIAWVEREKEMFALMKQRHGVGLAATQIGSSYRMFVMKHSILGDIGVYNPEILETTGEASIEEGCLTWPMLYITITRPSRIKVRWTKADGTTQVETWMDGIDARCFLHEKDHLDGINFIDLVSEFKLKRAKQQREKRLKKLVRKFGNASSL